MRDFVGRELDASCVSTEVSEWLSGKRQLLSLTCEMMSRIYVASKFPNVWSSFGSRKVALLSVSSEISKLGQVRCVPSYWGEITGAYLFSSGERR